MTGRAGRRFLAVAVLAATVWSVLGLAGVSVAVDPFRPRTVEVVADFPRTVGLYPQSRVRVDGIDSGWVTAVEPGVDGVTVKMRVHDVALASDVTATLRLKSMIGERYVELGPSWGGRGARLESGARIPRSRVRVPAEMSDVLDDFTRLAERVDKRALGRFVHQLAVAVDGRQSDLGRMVHGMAEMGRVVSGRADDIDRSITNLQRVMQTLARRDDGMVRLMRAATTVSDTLLAQGATLDAAISGVDDLLGQVGQLTRTQKDKLAALLGGLDRVGEVLARHTGDFEQVTDLLPSVAYGYLRAVDNDGTRWFTVNNPQGILFLPYAPNINSRGGPGSDRSDGTVIPRVDHRGSPIAGALPNSVDLSGGTGDDPLVPGATFSVPGASICHDEGCEE
jgi:phospholipid/cholesterol/gamma-HCH transport system substrate-binding protein